MAKKRTSSSGSGGGGGSNLGLIMTLVFFILATVVLGVTTYMGFTEVEKEKAEKKKATDEKSVADKERDFWRIQAQMYRTVMGQPMKGVEAKDLATHHDNLLKDPPALASPKPEDAKELKDYFESLEKQYGVVWKSGELAPEKSFDKVIADLQKDRKDLIERANQLSEGQKTAIKNLKDKQKELDDAKATHDAQLVQLQKKATADRKSDRDEIGRLQGMLNTVNKDLNNQRDARATAEKDRDKLSGQVKTARNKESDARKKLKDVIDDRDNLNDEVRKLYEVTGKDRDAVRATAMDEKAMEKLKTWNRNWQIVRVDRQGKMPYINLGSEDQVSNQVTFSVHAVGADGKLKPAVKGTLEVVKVLGPHLSRARLTSVKDAKTDPIMKGDHLFNATWDPRHQKRVAICGLVDLGGEGLDNAEDFRRLLHRQKVLVSAYIDTKSGKTPELKDAVTSKTDYLIVGDTLEGANHDKARDKEFSKQFKKLMDDMRDKARANGVTIVSLKRYLDMIGYRPTKVTSTKEGAFGDR